MSEKNFYYSAVGRCIYCGVSAEEAGPKGLHEEHIIPYSLGGTLILPKASCDQCAAETHAFEGYCAGKILRVARAHFHWRSRKTKRPLSLKSGLQDIPLDDYPPAIILPTFLAPGIIVRRIEETGVTCTGTQVSYMPGFLDKLNRLGPSGISVPFVVDPFFKMLAKIAHAYAVAELGLGGFTPFLPELILGRCTRFSYYIGSAIGSGEPAAELHTLTLDAIDRLVLVYVRLYAKYKAEAYIVVPGQRKP